MRITLKKSKLTKRGTKIRRQGQGNNGKGGKRKKRKGRNREH